MTQTKKVRVLYLGTGAPHAPSTGMDVVTRVHLEELLSDPSLEVTGLVVASSSDFRNGAAALGAMNGVRIIAGDPVLGVSRMGLGLAKVAYAVAGDGAMPAFSFRSASARGFIRETLASGDYDLVIIEQFITVANIKLRDLRRCRAAILFILHDVTPHQLDQLGRQQRRWYKRLLFALHSAKANYNERMLQKLAKVSVFLSKYDQNHYSGVAPRQISLLPLLESANMPSPQRQTERFLLFTGSPNFTPNSHAIDWLIHELAPVLAQADPTIRILLVGKGTDRLDVRTDNVAGLGFVPDEQLTALIDTSIGVICPLMHGSGIKIKILEALARGCLVFATEMALRGMEDFAIEPVIETSDPAGSAHRIMTIVNNPAELVSQRTRLSELWHSFCQARQGRLAMIVREAGLRA